MSASPRIRVPSYRHHRASGQAVVTLCGKDFYLGPWSSEASRREYDRIVGEWQANGRQLPDAMDLRQRMSVNDLMLAYWRFAETYYRKNGVPTTEQASIRESLRPLRRLYGTIPAGDFGPLALKTVRQALIDADLTRSVINSRIGRIKRMFKWAVENEMVPADRYHGLQAVAGLKRGRCEARESTPVRPVPEEHVTAILPFVSPQVQAMIELQLLTGMRPGEVRLMRGCDLDTAGRVWVYTPQTHKTEHHGIDRPIYLGPRAQRVVRPFLKPDTGAYLFSPRDAEAERNRERRRQRRTPMTPSQVRRKRKRNPKRAPTVCYTKESYYRAIYRACELAGSPSWHPNQLRHNAATRFRKEYGLEAAQVLLGHRSADVTQIYAERDHGKAVAIMERIG